MRRILLLAERHTVSTLILSGICFVGADGNLVEGAVVFLLAMMGTLTDSALDGLVGMTVHK